MVVIRLARTGAKKSPFYHLVVTDKRNARDGRFIERVGYFNPVARGQAVRLQLEKDRIDHWMGLGAQPSERVQSLIKEHVTGARPKKRVKKKPAPEAAAKPADDAEAKEATPADEAKAEDSKPAEDA